ncbi:hypothetical protein M0R45_007976 [Rubus argutus]|uniref:AMP-dependent synthetase/ligase domain-containing protein n=1 Tax=Rubus argutus TaxID=59490 RepID=A0AAW1Y0P7_RUBAR
MIEVMDLSNCWRLVKELVKEANVIVNDDYEEAEALFRLFLSCQQSKFTVRFPGSKIPKWFSCQMDFQGLRRESVKRNPSSPMLGERQVTEKEAGPYVWIIYQEVHDAAIRMGSTQFMYICGDRCGMYGSNCPQWIIAMEACNSHAITYVPLYDTLGANAVEFIINHAEVSTALVQENKISAILSCLPNCSTHLKTIVSFTNVSSAQKGEAKELGVSCFSWEEFSQLGNLDCELPPKQRTAICTIMDTSGTTGEPKGIIITNAAFMSEVLSTDHLLFLTDKSAPVPMYGLLHIICDKPDLFHVQKKIHIFRFFHWPIKYDQIIESYCIYKGIGFWRGDIKFLLDDLQELKPTMFCGVPWAYDLGKSGEGSATRKAAPLLDKLVFDKIKQALGGRVRILLSGYGLTESCGVCFMSIGNVYPMIGTVGVPITTIEARLESVPEMGYDALSSVPHGEICLRGKTLFSGDIGEWQPDGAMKIRQENNIFKLSQGEYVAVESIEREYLQCPLITSIWVYGNRFESFLVAVVVPDRKALEDWAAEHHLTDDYKSLCQNLKARKYILDELNCIGQKQQLQGFELLKAVHLEPNPLDIGRDLMTPTFKLKRPQLLKYYKDRVEKLYSEAKGGRV